MRPQQDKMCSQAALCSLYTCRPKGWAQMQGRSQQANTAKRGDRPGVCLDLQKLGKPPAPREALHLLLPMPVARPTSPGNRVNGTHM